MKTFKQFKEDNQYLPEGVGAIVGGALKLGGKASAQTTLRPLVKGASYLMRKLANTKVKNISNIPNIKKSDLSQYAMYHGTAKKSADKIMKSGKFKKSAGAILNPDGSVMRKKRAFATTDPEVAKVYADVAAKRTGGKPEILAVKVRDSKLYQSMGGESRGEYYIKTKHMKPVGRGVKPIKIKKGEVMQNSFNPLEEKVGS